MSQIASAFGPYAGWGATSAGYGNPYGMQSQSAGFLSGGYGGGWGSGGCGWGGSSSSYLSGFYLGGSVSHTQVPVWENMCVTHGQTRCWTEQQTCTTQTPGKMWDVWFDHQDGQKTVQRSPIVLDLNGNGKPDITGQNILGDGKVSGEPVMFDLDPSKSSWETKSIRRRPGNGAPAIKSGKVVYEDGTEVQFNKNGRPANRGASKAYNAHKNAAGKFYDADGKLVGETKKDDASGKMMYHWGKNETREKTEWLAKNGGDGLLVWDVDNDGQITSSKELFGEFDVDGQKKFKDGYEKLATHFDKNGDGKVEGCELRGLKVWKDQNGDAKVDAGELQELSEHNITSLDVKNINRSDMSSSFNRTETHTYDVHRSETTWHHHQVPVFRGYQDVYNVNMFGGWFSGGFGYQGGYGGGGYWS